MGIQSNSSVPMYYLCEWTVLALYTSKIIQLKNNDGTNNEQIVVKRINRMLKKIVILALIHEIIYS